MKFFKHYKIVLIAFALSGVVFLIAANNLFQKWNWVVNDSVLYSKNNQPAQEIVIVTIDDKSLADNALGRWQDWKRSYYADLIEVLEKHQAAVIGLDITFSEKSADVASDQTLAETLNKFNNIVIGQDAGNNPVLKAFVKDAASVGIVEFPVDSDQNVRDVFLDFKNADYTHFSIAILKKYLNISEQKSYTDVLTNQYVISEKEIRILGKQNKISTIPLDSESKAYLNFFGGPNSFQRISFVDVIRENFDPGLVQGKIILVGEDASSLYDEKMVPVSAGKPMAGVEIHANLIQTILEGKFLIPQSLLQKFITILMTVFLACFIFYFLSPFQATFSFVLIFFLILVVWAQIAPQLGRMVDVFYVMLGVTLSYMVIFVYRYTTVEKARLKIEKAFSHYVSKDVVAEIKKHPKLLRLGGEKRIMTAFFSDIEGFTSVSEKISPEALVALLNEYFAAMTKILFRYGGTLDKYEGDAIMAFWNAPLLQPDHAQKACITALKMQQHLRILRLKWKQEGKPEIKVRMGINTGDMIVGNVGSAERFDYTVMGDAVNLSSRLEGANKQYGTYIMVAESTYEASKNDFEFRELDLIKVKGKENSVRVYELVARKGHLEEKMQRILPHYKAGLEAYYQRKWHYALTHFDKILEIDPLDGPANLYVKRCQNFQQNPPAQNWDGSYTMQEK